MLPILKLFAWKIKHLCRYMWLWLAGRVQLTFHHDQQHLIIQRIMVDVRMGRLVAFLLWTFHTISWTIGISNLQFLFLKRQTISNWIFSDNTCAFQNSFQKLDCTEFSRIKIKCLKGCFGCPEGTTGSKKRAKFKSRLIRKTGEMFPDNTCAHSLSEKSIELNSEGSKWNTNKAASAALVAPGTSAAGAHSKICKQ